LFLFWPLLKLEVLMVLPLLMLCNLFDRTRRNDAVLAMFDRCTYDPWYDRDAVVRSRLAGLLRSRPSMKSEYTCLTTLYL